MATLRVWKKFEAVIDGVSVEGGSLTEPETLSVTGPYADLRQSIGTETMWDVWAAGAEEPLSSFSYLYVESDKDVYLELTVDKDADIGAEVIAIQVPAGRSFDLFGDDAWANYT